jgi:acid phosphatase family membrane protein YuiD
MLILPVIGTGLCGQLFKMAFHSLRARRWRPGLLADFESFPSLHPLVSGSLCYQVAEATGWASPYTAVAMGFTGVVVYDTAGVKRAAGRQARILMRISPEQSFEHRISELLGQSPARAWIAAFAGLLTGLLLERGFLAVQALAW